MIVLSRAVVRAFRALARKCHPGRPRGPAPPVTLHQTEGRLALQVDFGEVALTWIGPAPGESETLVVPAALLDAIDGPGDDPVQVKPDGPSRVVARWADRGVPRSFVGDSAPVQAHAFPEDPKTWGSVPPTFLRALHEAGRTAARNPTRYALHRIQIRGKKGQVVGTDGKRAFLRSGFKLSFPEDLLVPAVPVFGAREFTPTDDVRVGRTDTRFVVTVGPWAVGLSIDTEGRYPDVAGALPKNTPTVVGIDELDAVALLDVLPGLPGVDGETDPVTLAVDGGAFVRVGKDEDVVEVYLARSTVAGPMAVVPLVRADLRRMLALGCRTLRWADADRPVVGQGENLTFAAMPLNEACAVPPSPTATRLETDDAGRVVPRTEAVDVSASRPVTIPIPSLAERNAMKPTALPPAKPEPNGEALDPLAEAEGLRNALTDVITRVARLVAALKQMRREKRALSSVYQSLKDLNLGA